MFSIDIERPEDGPLIDPLLDRAFGTDRHSRTSYRLRDGIAPVEDLSFVAREGDRLVGTIRFWQVVLWSLDKPPHLALFLGPLAVDPLAQAGGIGLALLRESLAEVDRQATDHGPCPVILVGDLPYYARVGFVPSLPRQWNLPGPVDAARLLVRTQSAEEEARLPFAARLGPISDLPATMPLQAGSQEEWPRPSWAIPATD